MTYNINPTDKTYPYRRDDTLKDSQVSYNDSDDLINVSVPVISPRRVIEIDATYEAVPNDDIIVCTGNTFTLSLPTSIGIIGSEYIIKNLGIGTITVEPFGSQTIDGFESITLALNESSSLVSDGSNWLER